MFKSRISGKEVATWVTPHLDTEAAETILVGVPGDVRSLLLDGALKRWPAGSTWVVVTELQLLVASRSVVHPIPWYAVTGCAIEGDSLRMGWFGTAMQNINQLDMTLNRASLRAQPLFASLMQKLMRNTVEAMTQEMHAVRTAVIEAIRDREAFRISAVEADKRITEAVKAFSPN